MSDEPLFTALATSTKQLYLLLRAISFSSHANLYILAEGIRVTTEDARTIQASTLLDKSLFSSYLLRNSSDVPVAPFKVNILALLEVLQIFGSGDTNSTYKNANGGITSTYTAAFNTPALGLGGTCRISYADVGAPLSVTIEEAGVKTTCQMNTYGLTNMYEEDFEIPLDRTALVLKSILPSVWLHDAVSELASTNSDTVVVNASSTSAPYFALEGHGGPFGDTTVDYHPDAKTDHLSGSTTRRKQPQITETFVVSAPAQSHNRVRQRYKFDLVKRAGRAMALANKVSIRLDRQGVLSFQFMVEAVDSDGTGNDGTTGMAANSGRFSFIDFRFVPLLDQSDDEDDGDGETETMELEEDR